MEQTNVNKAAFLDEAGRTRTSSILLHWKGRYRDHFAGEDDEDDVGRIVHMITQVLFCYHII